MIDRHKNRSEKIPDITDQLPGLAQRLNIPFEQYDPGRIDL